MSKVSKLAIKACKDNKFSSFTGEFITSINPENIVIKSGIQYHTPQGIAGSSLLRYRGSPPKLLTFSLLFDNTGIIPGSNTINVMEQVKQLQEVTYQIHKKNNAPNYIRVIWGQVDFKGRLVELDIDYGMFQVDGTLVRAEAHMAVLEEIVASGKGKSDRGVDGSHAQPAGATGAARKESSSTAPDKDTFAETPNGMNGAYSGAPPDAYEGGPDDIYHGTDSSGKGIYSSGRDSAPSSAGGVSNSLDGPARGDKHGYGAGGSSPSTGRSTSSTMDPVSSGNGKGGGIVGNGPGGSGGGVGGGGGSVPGSNTTKQGRSKEGHKTGGSKRAAHPKDASKRSSSPKQGSKLKPGGNSKSGGLSNKMNSLRKLDIDAKGLATTLGDKVAALAWWSRLKLLAKKVAPKAYNAAKNVVK